MARIEPRTFTPAEAADITGVSAEQQRDWRRRQKAGDLPGNLLPRNPDHWSRYSVMELAKLFLVRTLRAANFPLETAWKLANDEIAGSVVVHAAISPHAVTDNSGALKKNPSLINKLAFELTGRRAVGGPFFAWGRSVEPSCYASLEHVHSFADPDADIPEVISTIDLKRMGELLAKRAGVLATIEPD